MYLHYSHSSYSRSHPWKCVLSYVISSYLKTTLNNGTLQPRNFGIFIRRKCTRNKKRMQRCWNIRRHPTKFFSCFELNAAYGDQRCWMTLFFHRLPCYLLDISARFVALRCCARNKTPATMTTKVLNGCENESRTQFAGARCFARSALIPTYTCIAYPLEIRRIF